MNAEEKQAYLEWIDKALKNAHSSYTKVELYEKKIRFLEHALDEQDREVGYLNEIITELRQVHQKRFEVYEEHFQENQRLQKALEEKEKEIERLVDMYCDI